MFYVAHTSPVLWTKQQACLIQTWPTFGFLCLFPGMPLTHKKHQLQREPCSFFMQAHFLSSWFAMFVTYIYIYIFRLSACLWFWNNITCYPIYMMLLLYFRRVTEKKTPLLRNHSICSGPQRFPFVLIILLSETSISNGLALKSHPKLLLSRHWITCKRLKPDLTEDLFALLS